MIYFRGCTAREKETDISRATEKLLKLADIEYHILDDEKCCGSVLFRTGFEDEALEQISKNTEVFKDELILTSCAGCYKTFKDDYDDVDVIHISQLIDDLIKNKKLNFSKKDLNVTFHDSCHLGRHSNVFDSPRDVIKAVANLVEMESIRENSLCCGAGGGVKSAYPEIASEMAKSRINQAKDTGCETLITACPFCKLNLENEDLEVLDLTEFLVKYGDLDES
ncbi:MAG: (Fe-S)-binding protein [Methanobrevibacter sp.]